MLVGGAPAARGSALVVGARHAVWLPPIAVARAVSGPSALWPMMSGAVFRSFPSVPAMTIRR
jgi:hypothetical protein